MKTLYVTDLDGTLLNTDTKLSENTAHTINELIDKGFLITYATARSSISAMDVTKDIKWNIPAIIFNGTFVVNPLSGEFIAKNYFTEKDIQLVKSIFTKYSKSPIVYAHINAVEKVSWVAGNENEGTAYYFSRRKGDRRHNPLCNDECLYSGDIFYFTLIGDENEIRPIYEEFSKHKNHFRCLFHRELYRDEFWLEIMHRDANKATALKKLKKYLGCKRVVCFGDAINDLELFEESDKCIAVENAVDEIKKKADEIIGSNNDDGVAKWLAENYCPCRRNECERHGKCGECRKHHAEKNKKPSCER